MDFKQLNISNKLIENINILNISEPTEIQCLAIPCILQGKSVLVTSQTGSGKTLAYLLPLIQLLENEKQDSNIKMIVLVPTRELAQQAEDVCSSLCKNSSITCTAIYGGVPYETQKDAIDNKPTIIISTVGRLLDLMNQEIINLYNINYFVLDEVDQMLDLGFRDDILSISKLRGKNCITCGFSATITPEVKEIIDFLEKNITEISIENQKITVEQVKQSAYYVERETMNQLMLYLLRTEKPTLSIIFTRSRKMADNLTKVLIDNGFKAEAFHSERSQTAREHILERFKSKETTILVATDVMARGIDVDNISHVFNFGLPQNIELYIHRIGRTARAGKMGCAISLCEPSEQKLLESIQKTIKQHITLVINHPFPSKEVSKMLANLSRSKK